MAQIRFRYIKSKNETYAFERYIPETIPQNILEQIMSLASTAHRNLFIFVDKTNFEKSISLINKLAPM